MSFIGNSNSMIVHDRMCDHVLNIHPVNFEIFSELYHARSLGYQECGRCFSIYGQPEFKAISKAKASIKSAKYSKCISCSETRGIQRAHIIPKVDGGKDCMPLCPKCHWNYDHRILQSFELRLILRWVAQNHGYEFAEFIKQQYRETAPGGKS